MATTVTAGTLIVSVSESIKLNGIKRGSNNASTISSIGEISNRIMSVPTGGTDIIQFASAQGAGTFSTATSGAGTVHYMRFTNLDDTNFVTITCSDHVTPGSNTDLFCIKLTAGKTFMLGGLLFDTTDSGADGDDNALVAGNTIKNIHVVADTAAVDLEMYIAST